MSKTKTSLLTVAQAAEYIGVSERTLRRMIGENKPRPPEIRPSESVIRYKVSDLDDWLKANRAIVPTA